MGENNRRKFMVAGAQEAQAELANVGDMKKPMPVYEVKVQVYDGASLPVIQHPSFPPGHERMAASVLIDLLMEAAQVVNREHLMNDPSRIVRV